MDNHSERGTPDRGEDVTTYAERKLQGSILSGSYTDRCWIEALKSYRDRIQIDSEEETVIRHLRSVLRKLKKTSVPNQGKEFYGIEKTGDTVNVYVDWRQGNQPFGHYWFTIDKAIVIKPQNTLLLQLRILRSISNRDFSIGHRCPHCGKLPVSIPDGDPLNLTDIARQMQDKFKDLINPTEWWNEARPHLTMTNAVRLAKFCLLLVMAAVSGGAALMVKLLSLLNRTIHELGFFIRQATPFLMACLDMVNKCIGGFYLLLAMMWRDARRPAGPAPMLNPNQPPPVEYLGEGRYPYMRRNVQRPYLSKNAT